MTDVLMAATASGGEEVHESPDPLEPAGAAPVRRLLQVLEPSSLVPTYVGIAVVAIGFALIGIAWAKVAALTNVALQLPYVVSAGISGLAVVNSWRIKGPLYRRPCPRQTNKRPIGWI